MLCRLQVNIQIWNWLQCQLLNIIATCTVVLRHCCQRSLPGWHRSTSCQVWISSITRVEMHCCCTTNWFLLMCRFLLLYHHTPTLLHQCMNLTPVLRAGTSKLCARLIKLPVSGRIWSISKLTAEWELLSPSHCTMCDVSYNVLVITNWEIIEEVGRQ